MHPLTATWWRLFVNRTDGSLRRQGAGWHFDAAILTGEEVSRALSGAQSLGVYATDQHGRSRWLCLDADDGPNGDLLAALARTLAQAPIVTRRPMR